MASPTDPTLETLGSYLYGITWIPYRMAGPTTASSDRTQTLPWAEIPSVSG